MPTFPVQRLHLWSLATVIVAISTTTATAGSFMRGCAARDMQVLKLIEEREHTDAISAVQLRDAMNTLMHARIVCHEGYVVDALAIYDRIAKNIAPNPVMVGRTNSTELQ
jgi:hypothetical protein